MDWKIFVATFTAIFVAELADKTQLVGIGMSAKTGKPFAVLFGSIAAYAIVTVFSVLIGTVLGRYLKPEVVKYIGASLFIIIGILMFLDRV